MLSRTGLLKRLLSAHRPDLHRNWGLARIVHLCTAHRVTTCAWRPARVVQASPELDGPVVSLLADIAGSEASPRRVATSGREYPSMVPEP